MIDPTKRREWGLLRKLMERQAEAQDRIDDLRTEVSERSLLVADGYEDDILIATTLCLNEMRGPDGINEHDVIHAGEFLDHLDTQGFRITRKA
jgi:hypothetical protein